MSTEKAIAEHGYQLADAWQVGTYEWWPSADRLIWSPELIRIYGLKQTPAAEAGFTAHVHPEDRVRVEGETSTYLGSGAKSYSHSFRIVRSDGDVRVILDRGAIERDAGGNVRVIRGINIDVTDEAAIGTTLQQGAAASHSGDSAQVLQPDKQEGLERELDEAKAVLTSFFDGAPVGLGIWDSEFRFLHVNPELAAINGLPPDVHIGRRPDELTPDLADFDSLYRRWREILDTGEPWRGVEISGETPAEPGHLRHWEEHFFPVRIGDRNVGIAAVVQETTQRKAAEDELRASGARYRTLFEAIDQGFCVLEVRLETTIDYRVVEANPAFFDRTGFPVAIIGQWLRRAAPDLEEHWYETYGRVARTGESMRFEQHSAMLGRWFNVYAFRISSQQNHRVAVLFNDISVRKKLEEQNRLLMLEADHRSKNLLSLVLAIVRHTASSGADDFIGRFGERVQALAAAQDLLFRNSWKTAPFAELVRSQLAHFADVIGKRIEIAGPPLALTPDATQALGMALHELATNATKYGALSNETGRIAIRWTLEHGASTDTTFSLSWLESGGPPVSKPARSGFGSRVTTDTVQASTGGKVSVDFAPGGLCWRLSCPAEGVVAD